MPHGQTLHFPTNFSPDLVLLKYFTFIPSHTHSLFTLTSTIYLFTDSHNHFFFKFSFKTLKQTQFICNVTTTRMTWTPMNKNYLAETNFTKRAGKGGVINWTSAYIQAVATLSSRYANFSNSTEATTAWNTIVADPSTFLCWFYTVIRIVQLKEYL